MTRYENSIKYLFGFIPYTYNLPFVNTDNQADFYKAHESDIK